MNEYTFKSWALDNAGPVSILLLVVAAGVTIILAMHASMMRDNRFEDACRRAGGMVVSTGELGNTPNTTHDTCARVVQPRVLAPVTPDYR